MGVYIKGMDMPENCAECFVAADVCRLWEDFDNRTEERHSNCPLVEVKAPHGRLIDADAFLEDMNCGLWDWSTVDGITATTALKQTMSDLRNAPTVLEAEGKDDG